MQIRIRLFAAYREAVGQSHLTLDVTDGATVADVVDRLQATYPRLGSTSTNGLLAVNQEYVGPDWPLRDGDELALIPPVSGG